MDERLVFIRLIGVEDGGLRRYEFMFSDDIDTFFVEGDNDQCCLSEEITPIGHSRTYIVKMGFKLDLIQDNCCFSFEDAKRGIVSIAWENMDDYESYPDNGRLYFKFGDDYGDVSNRLYKKGVLIMDKEN